MQTLLFSIVIFGLAGVGLSLGVIFGRPPIKGSCGGLSCGKGAGCAGCPNHRNQKEG